MNNSIEIKSEKAYNYLNNNPWTLVLGAGICKNILPDWMDLTLNVVNEVFEFSWDWKHFKTKSDEVGFSLDSWLQAALNKFIQEGKSVDDFNILLEKHLYGGLITKAETYGIGDAIKMMMHNPHWLKQQELFKIIDFFETEFPNCTLLQLVETLLDSDPKLYRPESIITFNADPLLHSLLVIYGVKNNYEKTGDYQFPIEDYVRVTRPFESGDKKIPILHLHGAIYPQLPTTRKLKTDSRDNLIFSETSYTKTAGIMNSWAQNVFSYKSTHNRMVFIGLSMSDPNIRRWLSWSTENINAQLEIFTGKIHYVINNLWIKPKSKDNELNDFYSASLVHLSTKPGWIDDWGDVKKGLLNLMGKK
ncbi:MAG: SIR2 family protein [Aequorivita antarctica]